MKAIISIIFLVMTALGLTAEPLTLSVFLKEMADRDALTRISKIPYESKLSSSYDRASQIKENLDGSIEKINWFANVDYDKPIRVEEVDGRRELVVLDSRQPGVITRMWCPSDRAGRIRIYFDGSEKPDIIMNYFDFVGGNEIFPKPFSFTPSELYVNPGWRGRLNFFPIPYAKSCKVTLEGDIWYYQIHYREYGSNVEIETFDPSQLEKYADQIKTVGEKLTTKATEVPGTVKSAPAKSLAPGESMELTISKAAGSINKLLVGLQADDYQQALRSTVITLNFDGKQTAWIPAGSLAGVGYSRETNETYYAQADPKAGTITSLYMMPFQKKATITVTNHGKQTVRINKLQATVDDYKWDKSSLYFHATWVGKQNIPTSQYHDLNLVTIKGGPGRYVGTAITIFNTTPEGDTWWGEGDEKVYIDGENFPSQFGTGTEDYFGYAYCRPQRFWSPFCSQPRGEGNKKWGYTNNNRYHLLDDIVFNESLQFDMEILHPFHHRMDYAASTYYYATAETSNNIEPDVDGAAHKVSLTIDDVLDSVPSYGLGGAHSLVGALEKIEGETLFVLKKSGGNTGLQVLGGLGWSNDTQLLWQNAEVGDTITFSIYSREEGPRDLSMHLVKAQDYGKVQISFNGTKMGAPINLYSENLAIELMKLGLVDLKKGRNTIEVRMLDPDEKAKPSRLFGIDYISLLPVAK